MSSSRTSASAATRAGSPLDMSSITTTREPVASSASTTCEPMKPAPPVTTEVLTSLNLAGSGREPVRQQLLYRRHGLIDALHKPPVGMLARGALRAGAV